VLQRKVKRPKFTASDRLLMVLLARQVRYWKQALLIVQPDTLLRWHRDLFRWLWQRKSRAKPGRQPIEDSIVDLIKQMVRENRLWGAERIRGELLKLGIRVSKRTIQRYKQQVHPPHAGKQTWSTFVHNHAQDIWACDFLQVPDVLFRSTSARVPVITTPGRNLLISAICLNDRFSASRISFRVSLICSEDGITCNAHSPCWFNIIRRSSVGSGP
jgi:hypothetical protein